jgi:hypothetical protein
MRSKFRSAFWCALCGLCLLFSSNAAAQPVTHQVEKGETLWSISEKYFGTPDVWPKLWELNPFITNPHLLKPGDLIRISAEEPEPPKLQPIIQKPAPEGPKPLVTLEEKKKGIQVGKLTLLNARGFLSPEKERPLGVVRSSDSEKILLSKGDQLFLDFEKPESVKTGDVYLICRLLPLAVNHIVTQKHVGYLYPAHATVVLRERTLTNVFRAEIVENYREIHLGDLVLPLTPVPACLKPVPGDPALRGVVVATQGRGNAFGRGSVVYLDSGRDKGLFPGTLLELVRFKNVPDPQVPLEFGALFYELFQVKSFAELLEKIYRESPTYEKMIGRMIVLDSGPGTATALVLEAYESFQLGTFFRGVSSLMEFPGSRQLQLSCDLE